MMNTVDEILEFKGREVWTIVASQSVLEATALMETKAAGTLAVSPDGSELVGIISERDCARAVILRNMPAGETAVSEVMTKNVISVSPDDNVERCVALMTEYKIRHLPVVSGAKLVGMISGSDLMKFVVKVQSEEIETLENYIQDDEGGEG
ncbi:MAG: CBS domain-containing protein [Patiriisocius sp.]|jgi:CBS domain-containing protein